MSLPPKCSHYCKETKFLWKKTQRASETLIRDYQGSTRTKWFGCSPLIFFLTSSNINLLLWTMSLHAKFLNYSHVTLFQSDTNSPSAACLVIKVSLISGPSGQWRRHLTVSRVCCSLCPEAKHHQVSDVWHRWDRISRLDLSYSLLCGISGITRLIHISCPSALPTGTPCICGCDGNIPNTLKFFFPHRWL